MKQRAVGNTRHQNKPSVSNMRLNKEIEPRQVKKSGNQNHYQKF